MPDRPLALRAAEVPPRPRPSGYPAALAAKIGNRGKRMPGEPFALRNFGLNLTRLPPGAASALHHAHARQDEWVYVLEGRPTLVVGERETVLSQDLCAGFPAGGEAHHLVNRTDRRVLYLEVGDRTPGDSITYPEDDLAAAMTPEGTWRYTRKDGTPV